jgi:hypothetical protein
MLPHRLPRLRLTFVIILSTLAHLSTANYVFAQLLLSYTKSHTLSTWANDINLASQSSIDAFALHVAYPYDDVLPQSE